MTLKFKKKGGKKSDNILTTRTYTDNSQNRSNSSSKKNSIKDSKLNVSPSENGSVNTSYLRNAEKTFITTKDRHETEKEKELEKEREIKSMTSERSRENILSETNILIETKDVVNPLIIQKQSTKNKLENQIEINDMVSKSIVSSNLNSKKGFSIKKKVDRKKNWDDEYDW
jgi:hypothetical protein